MKRRPKKRQAGAILVWFALLLPLLLGMTGLVIDAGLLMASHRHLQNSVDAAALAGAHDLLNGLSESEAIATATSFVTSHNELADARIQVLTPPENGPYSGESGHVEVIAEHETATIFIQLLAASRRTKTAKARAVAGSEFNRIIDGIIALDHRASPGISITGNAVLRSTGRIIVNSESGGVDQDGNPIENGNSGFAAFVSTVATVMAEDVHVVGGANRIDRFQNIDGSGDSPLRTGQLPIADPFQHLPIPTVATGVVDVLRGAPVATANQMLLRNDNDGSTSKNYIETDAASGEKTMVLNPGIYESIDITGGKVRFRPGIYVLAAHPSLEYSVRILNGEIDAQGIMFYNTKDGYDPLTGQPDISDGNFLPDTDGANNGKIRINAALGFSGIDTLKHNYGDAFGAIRPYNNMLIFQRRRSISTLQIQGFTDDDDFSGAIYAKWAKLRMPAGGVLNSQLVAGTIAIPGHGDLLVRYDIEDVVKSLEVFLLE